jgi:AraC-like DNA-binding protein
MDAFGGLLHGPRARGAFALRSIMSPPWSVRVEDRAPLSLVTIVRGDAWFIPDEGEPTRLSVGDVVIISGPRPYTFADDPATEVRVVIHEGQRCSDAHGDPVALAMDLGVRSWGNDPDGHSVMLIGTYETDTEVGQRLLAALPAVAFLHAPAWNTPLVAVLAEEITKDEPGQDVVLDRLLDLLLVAALRAWFARPEAEAPAWYRAQADPLVGRALAILQHHPERPWTVTSLASELGASRALLARRFSELVGEPPISFLTGWRLALAADLLREQDSTIASVARQVGYSTPYALSTAFKRAYGVSPKQHRLTARAS